MKLVEVEDVEEWEVERILNKDSWEKEEDLENAIELVAEFEGRINTEVRR